MIHIRILKSVSEAKKKLQIPTFKDFASDWMAMHPDLSPIIKVTGPVDAGEMMNRKTDFIQLLGDYSNKLFELYVPEEQVQELIDEAIRDFGTPDIKFPIRGDDED